jgi:hypothetical protein
MPLPSSIALRIVEKSSSISIISAASFATSVPCLPMAIPMSAFFSAGASLTPSPVMATRSPRAWNARTILSLCSGLVRAKMVAVATACSRSRALMASTWSPRSTDAALCTGMPSCRAMATAVASASPVTMTTRTPPAMSLRIDRSTPRRGGSFMPTSPANASP